VQEGNMLRKILAGAAGAVLAASVAFAGQTSERKDLQVLKDVATSVDRYAQFTIFDDVSASVKDGVVTLTGKVTMPYKRDDIAKRVGKVDGVKSIRDEIAVLPVSQFDDELRVRIARSIHGHSNFWNYAVMPNPPIHIVVEHGRVTLTGVVQSDVDRMLARSLATQFGALSVTNALKTDAEVQAVLEKSE
jgi:osmotically-inducible protein OsmY